MTKKQVLVIGFDPSLVDFIMIPDMNAEKVRADLEADKARLASLGYEAELCLTDLEDTAADVVSLRGCASPGGVNQMTVSDVMQQGGKRMTSAEIKPLLSGGNMEGRAVDDSSKRFRVAYTSDRAFERTMSGQGTSTAPGRSIRRTSTARTGFQTSESSCHRHHYPRMYWC